jgi:hypothetical protein
MLSPRQFIPAGDDAMIRFLSRAASRARAFAAAALAAFLAACATPLPGDVDQNGSLRILAHTCDGERGVDSMLVRLDKPGELRIRWSNRGVCGDPA